MIHPKCDEFIEKIKEAKKAHGKTNQDIADATGIPLSNISKFLSGNLANPNIFNAAAVCIYLGISLDEAFGMKNIDISCAEQIIALESRIHELQIHLDYAKQDKSNLEKTLTGKKMTIAVLFGVIILLITIFGIAIVYDISVQDEGFIRSGTSLAPVSIICITSVMITVAFTVCAICLSKRKE